jgi:hypothetical protein
MHTVREGLSGRCATLSVVYLWHTGEVQQAGVGG